MNVQRISALIAHLEALPPERFDMSDWWYERLCGTAGCIAGHAVELFAPAMEHRGSYWAREVLDITTEQADSLFYADYLCRHPDEEDATGRVSDGFPPVLSEVTTAQAVAALRNLLEHGECRWEQVFRNDVDDDDQRRAA